MNLQEYRELMRDEWSFHRRNPEMFLVWVMMLGALIALFVDSL